MFMLNYHRVSIERSKIQDLATTRGVPAAPRRQTSRRQGGDAGAAGGQGRGGGAAAAWHAGRGLESGWIDAVCG